MLLSLTTELQDLAVLDALGERVGRIHDVLMDAQSWTVKAIVVRLDRKPADRLGLHSLLGHTDLPLPVLHVHAVSDVVLLRDTLADLVEQHGRQASAPLH